VTGGDPLEEALHVARAAVLADLAACGLARPATVDVVEDVVVARRWWVRQWPEGASAVAGQIAQDVQDRLRDDEGTRWPECSACPEPAVHVLRVTPDLGPDPRWVCEESGTQVAALGRLPRPASSGPPSSGPPSTDPPSGGPR
jgi:hypothetical protein